MILCEMAIQNQFNYCLMTRKLKLRVTIQNLNQFFMNTRFPKITSTLHFYKGPSSLNGWKQSNSTEWIIIIFAAIIADCHLMIYRVEKSAVVEQIIEVGTVDCRYCMLTIPGLHLGCSPLKSRSRRFLKPLILARAPWHLLRLQDWLYRLIKATHVMIDYDYLCVWFYMGSTITCLRTIWA